MYKKNLTCYKLCLKELNDIGKNIIKNINYYKNILLNHFMMNIIADLSQQGINLKEGLTCSDCLEIDDNNNIYLAIKAKIYIFQFYKLA